MSLFDADLVQSVMMHLRPRHLLRLMQANKQIYRKVRDNDQYFTRVAVHLLYESFEFEGKLPTYRRMQNLPCGYHSAMEDFVVQVSHSLHKKIGRGANSAREAMQMYKEFFEKVEGEPINMTCDMRNPTAVIKHELNTFRKWKLGSETSMSFFRLSNELEDDHLLSIKQKQSLASCIIDKFKAKPIRLPVDEDEGVLAAVMLGFSTKILQQMKYFDALCCMMTVWINHVYVAQELRDIDLKRRARYIRLLKAIILKTLDIDVAENSGENPQSSLMVEMVDASGTFQNALKLLEGNARI